MLIVLSNFFVVNLFTALYYEYIAFLSVFAIEYKKFTLFVHRIQEQNFIVWFLDLIAFRWVLSTYDGIEMECT